MLGALKDGLPEGTLGLNPFAQDIFDFGPCPWDPELCTTPDLAEGPQQKGRNPKNYRAQYQPQGGREHVPNKKARDAARARRKKR